MAQKPNDENRKFNSFKTAYSVLDSRSMTRYYLLQIAYINRLVYADPEKQKLCLAPMASIPIPYNTEQVV